MGTVLSAIEFQLSLCSRPPLPFPVFFHLSFQRTDRIGFTRESISLRNALPVHTNVRARGRGGGGGGPSKPCGKERNRSSSGVLCVNLHMLAVTRRRSTRPRAYNNPQRFCASTFPRRIPAEISSSLRKRSRRSPRSCDIEFQASLCKVFGRAFPPPPGPTILPPYRVEVSRSIVFVAYRIGFNRKLVAFHWVPR